MNMSESQYCFIPDSKEVFVIAQIIEYLDNTDQIIVKEVKNNRTTTLKKNQITLIGSMEELENPPSDLIKLVHVNRPGILHTLRTRFMNDQIYTSIGPILVALNPFKWIKNLYDDDIKEKYNKEERFLTDSPHVFAIAHEAFRDLHLGINQSLIISGESGAGKTEATKQCLNYLAYSAGSSSGIQAKILKASPVLEGWGNAKTLRNNNSSRFGKFIEIWFDYQHMITGASNTTYILEKSRVVYQEKDERNYHIFYQLLKGADAKLLKDLELEEFALHPEQVSYINQSGCINIDDVDDAQDFHEANQALIDMGFTQEESLSLYAIIAGILLLGNVNFEPHPTKSEESIVTESSKVYLQKAIRRFGVDASMLERGLLFKQIKSGGGKRGSITLASYTPSAAVESRNALVKETYKRCFDWIVAKINTLMKSNSSDAEASTMIGILDIFGFEIFQKNSFEQLCINLANEALQQHFNYNIFQAELDVYRQEDVPVPPLEYKDNQDVLDMIMKKPKGLIPILDEEGIVPKGSWEGFISKFSKQHATNPRFKKTRNPHDLGIVHYAGEVIYDPSLFLIKNKDTLSADLIEAFSRSNQPLLHDLYDEEMQAKLNASASGLSENDNTNSVSEQPVAKKSSIFSFGSSTPKSASSSESKMTVGRKFSMQLDKLIAKLNSTKPRYIRCIKPNQAKKPLLFISDLTNEQLTYSGVFEAVIIMQNGYPFRMSLFDFRKKYHLLLGYQKVHTLLFEEELAQQYISGSLSLNDITLGPNKQPPQKGLVRRFPREQCKLMIKLLSEYAENEENQQELQKCYTGQTRVFYQAKQHNILEKWSMKMISKASIKIQSQARRKIAGDLISEIRKDEKLCSISILSRDISVLKATAQHLEIYLQRLNKAFPYLSFTLDIAEIGLKYAQAVELEIHCTNGIKVLLDDPRDSMIKYDELEILLNKATSINFSSMYRGIKFAVDWEQNPDLVSYAKIIQRIGIPVLIQRKFNEGIQSQDDDLLKIAIRDLENAKSNSDIILPLNFCVEELKEANQIVIYAEQLYATFILKVIQAVKVGNLTSKRKEGSFELIISVNSNSLASLYQEYNDNSNNTKKKISTKKIKLTLAMCLMLCELRISAEQKKWEDVWANIQTNWKEYLSILSVSPSSQQSGETSDIDDSSNNLSAVDDIQLSNILVPGAVTKIVYEEIKSASVIAINYFFVPQLEKSLKINGVPDIPYWDSSNNTPDAINKSPGLNPNQDLIQQIIVAESYAEYFDDTLNAVLLRAKEHLFVRDAIFSLDVSRIKILSKQIKYIPNTNSDYINAIKYEEMFQIITDLQYEILENRLISTPTPGKIDFSKIEINELQKYLTRLKVFIAKGNLWDFLTQLSNEIYLIRTMFKENSYLENSYMNSKNNLDGMLKSLLSNKSILEVYPIAKELITSAMEETIHYHVEMLHSNAIVAITSALSRGMVSKDVNDKSILSIDSKTMIQALEMHRSNLIFNDIITIQWLNECDCVAQCRQSFVIGEQWDEIERLILPMYNNTNNFQLCQNSLCKIELKSIYDKYIDNWFEKNILLGLNQGYIQILNNNYESIDIISIDSNILLPVIQKYSIDVNVSRNTKKLIFEAKFIYCLRYLVIYNHWEPNTNLIFFGSCTIENLQNEIQTNVKTNKEIIKNLLSLEDNLRSSNMIETLINNFNIQELSIAHLMTYFIQYPDCIMNNIKEINEFKKIFYYRRCLVLLLLGSTTNQITGTINQLDISSCNIDYLSDIIQYVETHSLLSKLFESSSSKNKDKILIWTESLKVLLNVRSTILEYHSDYVNILQPKDLNTVISQIRSQDDFIGFPVEEMELVYFKLIDLRSINKLVKELAIGSPSFENQQFIDTKIEYTLIEVAINEANEQQVTSEYLSLLLLYANVCLQLRIALDRKLWELSSSGSTVTIIEPSSSSSSSMGEKTVKTLTVKQCLVKYEEIKLSLNDHTLAKELPPTFMMNEFSLVSREYERRLLKNLFLVAFHKGALLGNPLALQFENVRSESLENAINQYNIFQSKEMFKKEIDKDIILYVEAANELLQIRIELTSIFNSYKRKCKFTSSSTLSSILENKQFLSDAISKAVSKIEFIHTIPYQMTSEWVRIEKFIKNLNACMKISFLQNEIKLLITETIERKYIADALYLFNQLKASMSSIVKQKLLIEKLLVIYREHEESLLKNNIVRSMYNTNTHHRASQIIDYINHSVVVLIHILRANTLSIYDHDFDRHWRSDVNYTNTPKIYTLIQTVQDTMGQSADNIFTKQQILRSSFDLCLHPEVSILLDTFVNEVEVEVSSKELKEVCSDSKYSSTGSIGQVIIASNAEDFTKYVLDRIENRMTPKDISMEVTSKSMFGMAMSACLIIRNLRNIIQSKDYSQALYILKNFFNTEDESLELMIQIIFEKKYQIISEAEIEFHFLANEVMDQVWQLHYGKSLISAMIQGNPGALITFGVSCSPILQKQSLLRFMKESSEQSLVLKQFGESLMKLRQSIIVGSIPDNLQLESSDSSLLLYDSQTMSHTYSKAQMMNRSGEEIIKITKRLSQYLTGDYLHGAIHEIELLTIVNISLSENARVMIESCIVSMLICLDKCQFLDDFIKNSIVMEISLISAHCLYLKTAFAIESAINHFHLEFKENGLLIECDIDIDSLQIIYENAIKLDWKLEVTSKDYWWAAFTYLMNLFLTLINTLEVDKNSSTSTILVQPGTHLYDQILPTIGLILQHIVSFVANVKKYSGLAKRQQFPLNLLHIRKHLELANHEHNTLQHLDHMINADKLICYCNDMFQMTLEVFPMYPVHLQDKGEFDDVKCIKSYDNNYYLYATYVRNMIESTIVDTLLGQKLKNLLLDIYDFRIEVTNHHWFNAEVLSMKCIAWIPEFPSRNEDVVVFNNYLKYIQLRRSLEHSILSCDVPDAIGWSTLGEKTVEFIAAVNLPDVKSQVQSIKDNKENEDYLLKYPLLNALIKILLKVIDLYDALQSHVWVDQSDRILESKKLPIVVGGTNVPSIPSVIDIDMLLDENIYTPYQQIDMKVTNKNAASIYKVLTEFKSLLANTLLLEDYFHDYLNRFVTKLENELIIIQLEQLSIKYMIASKIFGRAGELIIPVTIRDSLNCIIEYIETKDRMLRRYCPVLRQALQSAKIMLKLYQSHVEGDVHNLCKCVDLLIYLNRIEKKSIVAERNLHASADAVMLLKMNDIEYCSIYEKHVENALVIRDDCITTIDNIDQKQQNVNDGYDYLTITETSESELYAFFEEITSCSLSDAVNVRKEVSQYLPLLHKHAVFESSYSEFLIAIDDSPAGGSPGELDKHPIKFDRLDLILTRLSKYNDVSSLKMWGKTNILVELTRSISNIRKHQLIEDLNEISNSIQQFERVQTLDRTYNKTMNMDCNWFAGKYKHMINDNILEELDLAIKDLDQRMVITSMRDALFAHNIPLDDYPFDISNVETEQLENALKLANNTTLICTKAKELQHACSIIIVFRKLIVEKNWTSMMSYLENIKYLDLINLEVLTTFEEYSAAIYVTNVSYGIELALEAYVTGYLGGAVSKPMTCTRYEILGELNLLNSEGLQKALNIFELIDESKRSNAIIEHMNACRYLLEIRLNAFKENWDILYDVCQSILNKYKANELLLYSTSITEFEIAFQHAMYMISFIALNDAITSNGVYGMIGNIKLSSLSIQCIQKACKKVIEINCTHPDIILMLKGVELLFRLRKAILLDQWITIDHTKTYSKLLSPHFRFYNMEDSLSFRSEKLYLPSSSASLSELSTSGSMDGVRQGSDLLNILQNVPEVETVEIILQNWIKLKESKQLAVAVEVEVSLIYSEMLYRQLTSTLLHALDSPGFTGEPGQVNSSEVTTRKLDTAIQSINKFPIEVYQTEDCRLFLRDATFLLKARRFRLNEMWTQLASLLQKVEDIHLGNKNNQEIEAWERKIEHSERITEPVWRELQLLKYDRLFSLALSAFADEMMREDELHAPATVTSGLVGGYDRSGKNTRSSTVYPMNSRSSAISQGKNRHGSILNRKNSMLVTKRDPFSDFYTAEESENRVDRITKLYHSTKALADSSKSKEYKRLLEAMHLALELRTFAQLHPHRSPSDIVHKAAVVKKRDIKEGVPSYVSLLIYDISKLSNVLDFPLNLKIIRSELLRGKKYYEGHPVGSFQIEEIKIEVITTAYYAALPSLEIMGTDENYQFMKLTDIMIQIRNCVLLNDLYQIKDLISKNELILKEESLVSDEIERLLIEYDNHAAAELIEAGLRTGRYLNVLIIAKMVENYDFRMRSAQELEEQQGFVQINELDLNRNGRVLIPTKSVRKRSTHRHITFYEAVKYDLDHPPSMQQLSHPSLIREDEEELEEEEEEEDKEDLESYEFVRKVIESVSTLNRAVRIGNQLRIKSPKMEFYLETAQLILKLREGIVTDDWTSVRETVRFQKDQTPLSKCQISAAALEEIKAIQEGLSYKECIEAIKNGILKGAISGAPHDIDYDSIDTKILDKAIQAGREIQFVDASAILILDFAKRLYNIRYYLYEDMWRSSTRKVRSNSILSTTDTAIKAQVLAITKANRCSVEDALEDMLSFQSEQISKLQLLLGISPHCPTASTNTHEIKDVDEGSEEHKENLKQIKSIVWIQEIWNSIIKAQSNEVNLVLQAIQYLHLVTNLKNEVCNIPDVITRYLENKNKMYNSYYDEVKRFKVLDITEIDNCSDISQQIHKDPYHINALETIVKNVKEYLISIPFTASEDLLKLLHSAMLLLEFRSYLGTTHSNFSVHSLKELLLKAKSQIKQEVIAPLDGMKEINAFITITTKSLYIHNHLQQIILSKSDQVRGPLDQLISSHVDLTHIKDNKEIHKLMNINSLLHNDDNWMDETIAFLARAGRELSLGLLDLYVETGVIDKLRILLRSNKWLEIGLVLQQHKKHTKKWLHGIKEYIHFENSYKFHCLQNNMHNVLHNFQSIVDLKYKNPITLHADFNAFDKIFQELGELLKYSSELLIPEETTSSNLKSNSNTSSEVLSENYRSNTVFLASKALWRLLKALLQKKWFDKQQIHDNINQTIPGLISTLDPLLVCFFGIGDSNYIENIDNRQHFKDISLSLSNKEHQQQHQYIPEVQETVFNVLLSVNWKIFPFHIRVFFDHVRNCLIDHYIQSDLAYYCKKGAASVDTSGNLIISSLYYQLLQLSIVDIQKVQDLCNSYCITFNFHHDTMQWILASKIIFECRRSVVENNIESLILLLKDLGYLRPSGIYTIYNPKYYLIHDELQAYENYIKGYIAEKAVKQCIYYLMSSSSPSLLNNHSSYKTILNHSSINEVIELAQTSFASLQINTYHYEMLNFISLLKHAIHACINGIETKLRLILIEFSDRWIEKYQKDIELCTMYRAYISMASQLLIKMCKYFQCSDLFVMKNQTIDIENLMKNSKNSKDMIYNYASDAMKYKLLAIDSDSFVSKEIENFTIEIMKSLCELIYFVEEKQQFSSNKLSNPNINQQSHKNISIHINKVPYYTYQKLRKLSENIPYNYVMFEPKWILCLLIVIYYLRKEEEKLILARNPNHFSMKLSDEGDDSDNQQIAMSISTIQINISYDLSNFLKEINLEQIVLLDHLHNNHHLDSNITNWKISNLKIYNHIKNQKTNHNKMNSYDIVSNTSSVFMDVSPNMIIITKYLTSIKINNQSILQRTVFNNISLDQSERFIYNQQIKELFVDIQEDSMLWGYLYKLYEMIDIADKQLKLQQQQHV